MADLMEVRLYELYRLWCESRGMKPSIRGYVGWYEDKYMEGEYE